MAVTTSTNGIALSKELRIAENGTALVGNTPLVYLNKIAEGSKAKIAAKLEFLNPLGSVKDRIAKHMIEEAERKGLISPGKNILVEVTSGNTGIGLAAIAAQKGYKIILIMPHSCSVERKIVMLQLGAELILTDPAKGVQGILDKQDEVLAKIPHAYPVSQFDNPANPETHVLTTGPEIWRDTAGQVDIFVANSGTGGTISGVGKYLKSMNPDIKIIVVEPAESAVISGGPPGPHKIQGTGPGMIPPNLNMEIFDEIVKVTSDVALATAKKTASTDGLLVGISAGAAIAASVEVGSRAENAGKLIVTVLPSGGERYISTDLYLDTRIEAEAMQINEVYEPELKIAA